MGMTNLLENDNMVILSCPKRFDDWIEKKLKIRRMTASELRDHVPYAIIAIVTQKKWLAWVQCYLLSLS